MWLPVYATRSERTIRVLVLGFACGVLLFLIGPLFVVAEAAFLLGLRREVEAVVESRAGPVRSGRALAK